MATKTKVTTDHEEIRRWVEERGGHPAEVVGTERDGETGMIRIDFPGYSGEGSLREIPWDEWFKKFDESNLAFVYQDTTASGQKSNFNKLVGRETAEARAEGETKASRRSMRGGSRASQSAGSASDGEGRASARGRRSAAGRGRGSRAGSSRRSGAGAGRTGRTASRKGGSRRTGRGAASTREAPRAAVARLTGRGRAGMSDEGGGRRRTTSSRGAGARGRGRGAASTGRKGGTRRTARRTSRGSSGRGRQR
jgi:hypothetical protein